SLSITRFTVEGGTLTVDDRANGKQFQFNDVSATGDLQSRDGPVKIDASFKQDGKPRNNGWKLKLSTGQFAESKGKLRLSLTRTDATQFEADGMLSLRGAVPAFEGKINLAQPGVLPWKLAANAAGSNFSLVLDDMQVSLGGEAPIEFSGAGRIESFRRGLFEAELAAKFADLDRAEGKQKQNLAAALAPLKDLFSGFQGQPLSGRLKLTIAQLVAGGGNVRELSGVFSLHDGTIAPERLSAKLPGRGSIEMQGGAIRNGDFKVRWSVSAEEPAALAEWSGLLPPDAAGSGRFKLDGGLLLSGQKVTLDPFLLSLGDTKLGGVLAYEPAAAGKPARVDTKLNGNAVDLMLLAPLARNVLGEKSGLDVNVSLNVMSPRLLDQGARRLQASFSRKADILSLDRLSVEDMGGLNLTAHGEIASYAKKPTGRIEFVADAAGGAGLNQLADSFAGPETAAYIHRVTAAAMPLHLTGAVSGNGNSALTLEAKGKAGETQVALTTRADPNAVSPEDMRLVLESPDAANLVALLGLPAPEAQAGQGRFELALGKKDHDAVPLQASLKFPGVDLSGEGALRLNKGRVEPRINLTLEATDLRALSVAAARASGAVVPASGTARLIRAAGGIALEDVALDFGETRVQGRLMLKGIEAPVLSGELSVNRSDLATLLALALGRTGEGAPWSDQALGPRPLAGASGEFSIESAAFGLGGNLAATGVRMKLSFDHSQVLIEDFTGDLAGGKLSAHARISRPDLISFDGGFSLKDGDIARVLSPANWRSAIHGKGDLSVELAGQGASPAQLAGNIAGRGKFSLTAVQVEKLSPATLAKVLAATAKGGNPDENHVRALIAKALDDGPLKIAKIEGPIVAANGIVRTGKTSVKAGGAEVSADVAIDLASLNLNASVGFEHPPLKGTNTHPSFTVAWRGPFKEPERSVELAPLMAAISLRAMDNEMRKIRDRATAVAPPLIPPLATEAPPPAPKPKTVPPRPKPVSPSSIKLDPIH
ncbi:MAG TPA: AsmA-like C-terminal region-containing protein, partial [Xanthobacteraceae bacterium]|nr:AsmA-like C-terminal region-containing protein [Xanthobacteraceae bacterium]